jgi:hypothetical protein
VQPPPPHTHAPTRSVPLRKRSCSRLNPFSVPDCLPFTESLGHPPSLSLSRAMLPSPNAAWLAPRSPRWAACSARGRRRPGQGPPPPPLPPHHHTHTRPIRSVAPAPVLATRFVSQFCLPPVRGEPGAPLHRSLSQLSICISYIVYHISYNKCFLHTCRVARTSSTSLGRMLSTRQAAARAGSPSSRTNTCNGGGGGGVRVCLCVCAGEGWGRRAPPPRAQTPAPRMRFRVLVFAVTVLRSKSRSRYSKQQPCAKIWGFLLLLCEGGERAASRGGPDRERGRGGQLRKRWVVGGRVWMWARELQAGCGISCLAGHGLEYMSSLCAPPPPPHSSSLLPLLPPSLSATRPRFLLPSRVCSSASELAHQQRPCVGVPAKPKNRVIYNRFVKTRFVYRIATMI